MITKVGRTAVNKSFALLRRSNGLPTAQSKRFQATLKNTSADPARESKSYFGKVLGAALLLSTAYTGVTAYALRDEQLREFYSKQVPFGEESLEKVAKLEAYLKDSYPKAKEVFEDVLEKLKQSLSSPQSTKSKPVEADLSISEQVTTDKGLLKFEPTTQVENTEVYEKVQTPNINPETIARLKTLAIELKSISTNDPVLNRVVDAVGHFVRSIGSSAAKFGDVDLRVYNEVLSSLNALGPRMKELEAGFEKERQELNVAAKLTTDEAVAKERLASEVAGWQATQKLQASHEAEKQSLINQLHEQLDLKLASQAQLLERWWRRESKLMVDRERNQRLSKLNIALQQLYLLESALLTVSQNTLKTSKLDQMSCAIDALSLAVHGVSTRPFVNELRHLQNTAKQFPVASAVVESLDSEVARTGLPTLNDLRERFNVVRTEISRASLVPENAGLAGHLTSYALSSLLFAKPENSTGSDIESILARTNSHLLKGDLLSATRELNQVTGWPKKLAMDWLHSAVNRLEFDQALQALQTEVRLETLSRI